MLKSRKRARAGNPSHRLAIKPVRRSASQALPRPGFTRRRGKIAQLPKALRDEINRLIEDNVPVKQILHRLAECGHPNITARNLSTWIRGNHRNASSGFEDWRHEQQAIDDIKARQEFSLDLLRQNEGHSIHDAARLLAASQLAEVIADFDIQQLKDALSQHPEDYGRVVNALTKLSSDNLEYEKYRFLVAGQKRKIQKELNQARQDGGLSPQVMDALEQALGLL